MNAYQIALNSLAVASFAKEASKPGLWANINRRKRLGISRDKEDSTIDPKAYKDMKNNFGRKEATAWLLKLAAEESEGSDEKRPLNKAIRTPGESKKFKAYVKNENGNVVTVRFGDPDMEIKRDNPERRKNFRARHNCDNPGPKTKARYWSCKNW